VTVQVAIHDVTPRWTREIERLLSWAGEAGVRPALLVVPNYHGNWPIAEHQDFCAKLRVLQACGHDVLLHGYYHDSVTERANASTQAAGCRKRHAVDSMFRAANAFIYQQLISSNEAEFMGIEAEQADGLLERGARDLEGVGLRIDGFVAPAWSMPSWMRESIFKRGWRITEDHLRIYDSQSRRAQTGMLVNYATRTRLRLATTLAAGRLGRLCPSRVLVRVAIHPADVTVAILREEIQRLFSWAARRGVVSLGDLFDRRELNLLGQSQG